MSTRKSSQASGWPSAVGSIQPSPKLRFEADLLDRDAAECSACGLPQTQIPNPDAVTSTLYSLQAGVFSSGVVKLDGGDGGGGALSLPGVRGDVPSSALEGVQPIGTVGRGSPQGVVVRLRRLPSVAAALAGVKRGAFRPRLLCASPRFPGRPLSPWSMRGALFEASSERLVLVVGAGGGSRSPAGCWLEAEPSVALPTLRPPQRPKPSVSDKPYS